MTDTEVIGELNAAFSSPDAKPRQWREVVAVLTSAEVFWLSTVRRDGRPHVTPIPAIWLDGALHFCTGAHEQKSRNLEHEPRCVLTTGSDRLWTGFDVVVEGTAERVVRRTTLERLAELWQTKLDWTFGVAEDGFRDPEGRVAVVFGVSPTKVLAFGKGEPFSQTRFRFVT
jgi:general stress protein 26